jgi:hypothetical protein
MKAARARTFGEHLAAQRDCIEELIRGAVVRHREAQAIWGTDAVPTETDRLRIALRVQF